MLFWFLDIKCFTGPYNKSMRLCLIISLFLDEKIEKWNDFSESHNWDMNPGLPEPQVSPPLEKQKNRTLSLFGWHLLTGSRTWKLWEDKNNPQHRYRCCLTLGVTKICSVDLWKGALMNKPIHEVDWLCGGYSPHCWSQPTGQVQLENMFFPLVTAW